jgi:hypothetical protein
MLVLSLHTVSRAGAGGNFLFMLRGAVLGSVVRSGPEVPGRFDTELICGFGVENIEDPLTQKIHYRDKLVDWLAKDRSMEKVLRK